LRGEDALASGVCSSLKHIELLKLTALLSNRT